MTHIWILFLTESPEQPLGNIINHWFRMELQDAKANLPHIHSLLWTDEDLTTDAGVEKALSRIRGYIAGILTKDEASDLIEKGVYKNNDAVIRFLEMMSTILPHSHLRRCYTIETNKDTGNPEIKLKCKVMDNFNASPAPGEDYFIPVPVEHTQEAIRVMQEIGVADPPPPNTPADATLNFSPRHSCLEAKKHIPKSHGDEGIISPVPGYLVALNPNCDNLQYTTGYTLSLYLAKYISKIDIYNVIRIRPPGPDENPTDFTIDGKHLFNNKITGNRIAQKNEIEPSQTVKKTHARGFNIVEFYMLLFKYDPVMTNIRHVKISTRPYEERGARKRTATPIASFLRQNEGLQLHALTARDLCPCHHVRISMGLPQWRQFTGSQIRKITDDLQSPLTTDGVTIFGMRPPELRFVMHQANYARWFLRQPRTGYNIQQNIAHCSARLHPTDHSMSQWVDGTGSIIRVRAAALPEVILYLERAPDDVFGPYGVLSGHQIKVELIEMFRLLDTAYECSLQPFFAPIAQQIDPSIEVPENIDDLRRVYDSYICEPQHSHLPIPWMDSMRPTQPTRFLIHLLLSMGAFIDEYDLFDVASLRDAFVKARLLDPLNPLESAKKLMRRYLLEQLAILPAGTITFDRYCATAYDVIKGFFLDNRLVSHEVPTVLYCRLREEQDEKITRHILYKQDTLLNSIYQALGEAGIPDLPAQQDVANATMGRPLDWNITECGRAPDQPQASYIEQKMVAGIAKGQIDHYLAATNEFSKGVCIVGAGGVGKTTLGLFLLIYAKANGLRIGATAMMSERSQELACDHLNHMTCIPKGDDKYINPGQLAERGISGLYRNPCKLEYLRVLDVLLIDEAGAICAEMWSALDHILRYIRNSSKPFGGLFIIATMDHLQIHPINGRHPLLSSFFTTSFTFEKLIESVRAANDQNWQRIQAITRMLPSELQDNPDLEREFVRLLVSTCTWIGLDEAPPEGTLFVFGKNDPTKTEEARFRASLVSRDIPFHLSHSRDYERTPEGRFVAASLETSNHLDAKVKAPHELILFAGGRYTITYNRSGRFSNNQLAFLPDLPTQQHILAKRCLRMLVAPPGSRYIPKHTDAEQSLLQRDWQYRQVGLCPENIQSLPGRIRAKRTRQYGVRLYLGSTWHGTMGKTLDSVATRVERVGPYALWEPSQVVVMLSRTRQGRQTIFMSRERVQTARTIFSVLRRTSKFRLYISYLLERYCGVSDAQNAYRPIVIDQSESIYRPCDVTVPADLSGVAYILVSTTDTRFTYIGSTRNLIARFQEHNSGYGANQTAPASLRPWGILAYVAGFNGNEQAYKDFEAQWIYAQRGLMQATGGTATASDRVALAEDVMAEFPGGYSLRLVNVGTLTLARQVASHLRWQNFPVDSD